MPNKTLNLTAQLYRKLESPLFKKGKIKGVLALNEELLSGLKAIDSTLDGSVTVQKNNRRETLSNLIISGDTVADTYDVEIEPIRLESAFFAENLDDVIKNHNFRYLKPNAFYLVEQDYLSGENKENAETQAYFDALSLIRLIEEIADHTEKDSNKTSFVILFKNKKIEIPLNYEAADLKQLPELQDLKSKIENELHQQEKKTLLKKAIYDRVEKQPSDDALKLIIANFTSIYKQYEEDYNLYVSEFSFTNEREKLETDKQEYVLKLNKVLGDIQSKLLAIPVSLILVGGQMKSISNEETQVINFNQVIANHIIFAGALIFTILLLALVGNQRHSLAAIRKEYHLRKKRLEQDLNPDLYQSIKDAFWQLERRYWTQNMLLLGVNLMALAGLILSIILLAYFDENLWTNLTNYYQAKKPLILNIFVVGLVAIDLVVFLFTSNSLLDWIGTWLNKKWHNLSSIFRK